MHNVRSVCCLMIFQNLMNSILGFGVGIKILFGTRKSLVDALVPFAFFVAWIFVFYNAYKKNGNYNAPPGLLYMQQ